MLFRKLNLDWRYGLSELLIVVVGVFIALAADGWLQQREDRVTEREYIERLVQDLRLDTASVSNIMARTEERARYCQVILDAYDSGQRSGSASDFIEAVEFGNYFSYPSYSTTTIDELMSTGNLRLVRSTEVKTTVSRYYETIEWTEQFSEVFRPVQGALVPYKAEVLDLEQRYGLIQDGLSSSCGPTLSCDEGIPWAPSVLTVSEAEADLALQRLLSKPEGRSLYASMARIQAIHYASLASIHKLANDSLATLEQYAADGW